MKLAPDLLLKYQPGETPWSFCSRLGRRTGVGGSIFAQHCGTSLKHLALGHEDALCRLAAVAEMDVATLRAAAPISITSHRTLVFGEILNPPLLPRRTEIRFCPVCVADQEELMGRHLLTEWLVLPVTVCRHHNTRLELATARVREVLDPAPLLEEIVALLNRRPVIKQYPRALEQHLFARLDGTAEDTWLSQMPLHAMVSLSFAIGRNRGSVLPAAISTLSREEWHEAACRGYEILEGEEETIFEYLQIQDDFLRTDAKYSTPQNAYGDLYKYLSRNLSDSSFDHFRGIVAEHIRRNYPYRGTLFGRPTIPRRLRSISALGDASGIDPQRIRLLVKTEGYLTERPKGTRGRTVLSSRAADVIISSLRDGCTFPQLRRLLGARTSQVHALIDLGFIPSVGWRKNKQLFSRAAATRILTLVHSQLDGGTRPSNEILEPVTSGAIQQIVTDGALLKLIIGKKLKVLGASHDCGKLSSLLVSRDEVAEIVGKKSTGLTAVQIARRLKIRVGLWSELCQSRLLKDPDMRTTSGAKLTSLSEVEEFERRYISLGHIAQKLAVRSQTARAMLGKAKVCPLILPSKSHSIFERAHVEAVFPQLR